MDLQIKGKRALVFGASQGLGRAVAQALTKEGVRVAIAARTLDRLESTRREIAAELAIVVDVSRAGESRRAIEEASRAMGGVDILVLNTGGPPKAPFQEVTSSQWQEGFNALWMSVVEGVQAALPQMRERKWGRILLVTSAAAKQPIAGLTISNGLRAGLLGLANSLSKEVGRDGVTVNVLLPGHTMTERLKALGIDEAKIATEIPVGRVGKPEEFGATAAFLASEGAAVITGQAIAVDGGWTQGI
jgi:3-oxoacyl-[acyl-carrier protein] reductase